MKSAPDEDHRPVLHVLQVEHPGVLGLLPLDGRADQLVNVALVDLGVPQRVHQVDLGLTEEADLEASIRRHPQPVARAAKVLRHRGDEADLPAESGHVVQLGRVVLVLGHSAVTKIDACRLDNR